MIKLNQSLSFNNRYLNYLALFLLALALYWPTYTDVQFFWDDFSYIFANEGFLASDSPLYFWQPDHPLYRSWPLGYTLFWILYKLGTSLSFDPLIFFKTINIFLHATNACLVYVLFKKIKFSSPFFCSLFFLIHPFHVETVSWIFQLLALFSFFFLAISTIFIIRFFSAKRFHYYLFSFIFFYFSLSTKTNAIFFPLLLLCLFFRNFGFKFISLLSVPFLLLSLHYGTKNLISLDFLTTQQQHEKQNVAQEKVEEQNVVTEKHPEENKIEHIPPAKLSIFTNSLWFYASTTFFPSNLKFIYAYQDISLFKIFLALILIYGLPATIFYKTRNLNFLAIPIIFTIFYLPYSGLAFIPFFNWSHSSNHYAYFLSLIISFFVQGLLSLQKFKASIQKILIAYLLLFWFLNLQFALLFNNRILLYKETLTTLKHPLIYRMAFDAYINVNDRENAEKIVSEGLSYFPDDERLLLDLKNIRQVK